MNPGHSSMADDSSRDRSKGGSAGPGGGETVATEARRCGECGAVLTEEGSAGLCPGCLVALTLLGDPTEDPDASRDPVRFGDYELLEELGSGGMGTVFRVRQVSVDRVVALKTIRAGRLASAEDKERFRIEATAAARLDHPYIVPVYDVGEADGQPYFSMKLIEGASLARRLADGDYRVPGSPDPRGKQSALATLVLKVARAVAHAHERGVLHRDLKPGNILVDNRGEPHLTDFGLAKVIESGAGLTRTDAILGTVEYMSPEQASGGSQRATVRADVYSLGAVLYELLTGRPPFAGTTPLEVVQQILEREPVRPQRLVPGVDADLETICLKCLEKDPAARYASAGALAEDLQRWLTGVPIEARPSGPLERASKFVRRRPALTAVTSGVGLGLVVLALLTELASRRSREASVSREEAGRATTRWRLERTRDLFETEQASVALAQLARQVREDAHNTAAAARLMAALTQRPFAVPAGEFTLTSEVHTAGFSPDGQRVAVGCSNGVVGIWSVTEARLEQTFQASAAPVLDVAFSPDSRRLATASRDGNARVWSIRGAGPALEELALPHASWVRLVEFGPDGQRLLTVCSNLVRVWPAGTGAASQEPATVTVPSPRVRVAHFDREGTRVIAGADDGVIYVWDAGTLREQVRLVGPAASVRCLAFTRDGQGLVAGYDDGNVLGWDLERPGRPRAVGRHEAAVVEVAMHPMGRWVASASEDHTAQVWDEDEPGRARASVPFSGQVRSVGFSPDGRTLLAASDDGNARWWDWEMNRPASERVPHPDFVDEARVSPDGRHFLTRCSDHWVRLWQRPRPQMPHPASAEARRARGPKGARENRTETVLAVPGLRAMARGATVLVWIGPEAAGGSGGAGTAEPAYELAHGADVNSVALSPDGRRLAVATADRALHVWDVRTGSRVTDPIAIGEPVWEAGFSVCGRWVLGQTESGPLAWEVPPEPDVVPSWLADLGQAMAGRTAAPQNSAVPAVLGPGRVLRELRDRLSREPGTNGVVAWARWFLSDDARRPISMSAPAGNGSGSGGTR